MNSKELLATVEEIRLPMDGTYMNVIRFGCGPRNFVMISGISLCGLEGAGPAVANAYAEFTEDYTFYLFDRKKVLPQGYRVEDLAEDVYRALCTLGVQQADVYGVSQGGMIAQCLALEYPSLVRKLALCSTQARAGAVMKTVCAKWSTLAHRHDVSGLNRSFAEHVYSESFRTQYRDALQSMENSGTPEDCDRFAVLVRACEIFDVYDRLLDIHCPTLVIADSNDRVIDYTSGLEIVQAVHGEWCLYHNYSHAVFDEAPEAKQRVFAFLRG